MLIGFCNNTQFIIIKLGINIIGTKIIFKIVLILCSDVLIFVIKDWFYFINYNKKIYVLYYLGFI